MRVAAACGLLFSALSACGGISDQGDAGGPWTMSVGTGGGTQSSSVDGGIVKSDAGTSISEALGGTRLKRRYIQSEDGARLWQGFFDTMRGENCDFALAEDGRLRCLPWADAAYLGVFFSDSACLQRVAYHGDCGALSVRYAVEWTTQCPSLQLVYEAIEYSPDAGQLFNGKPGACTATQIQPGLTYYRLGAKVPATSFVAGNLMVEP